MLFKKKEKSPKKEKIEKTGFLAVSIRKIKNRIKLNTNEAPKQLAKEILIHAVLIQILLEILSKRALLAGFATLIHNPLMFMCSVGMIGISLSFGLLLPKRHVGYLLASTGWLWLGVVNFILLGSRTTPLTAMDFKMLTSVFTVIQRYLNTFQMIGFVIAMLLLVVVLVIITIKLPRTKWKPGYGIISLMLCYALMTSSFQMAMVSGNVTRNFGNIADAYSDYGFAYSFATSVVDRGIQKPDGYSTEVIDELLHSMETMDEEDDVKTATSQEALEQIMFPILNRSVKDINDIIRTANSGIPPLVTISNTQEPVVEQDVPNVIMIQLESFFDVKRLNSLSYSEDPTPNMTRLGLDYSSGFVTVPSIGAGTANTEFEILTGMSLDYFGAGEYPFKTTLSTTTVESYAYDLSALGYNAHAIHNNMGTFYARHSVYPKLGFDGFTSIEYMKDVVYNPLDWAKDEVLIPEILKAMEATTTPDFVFGVSVQPHGKYPEYPVIEDPVIDLKVIDTMPQMTNVDSLTDLETPAEEVVEEVFTADENYYKYLYYVNQIYECDKFVGDLIAILEDYDEPVVVVFYGDHLPTLDITNGDLTTGTPYQTEYVMWDNMGLDVIHSDLMAYQLGSMVMERLGYDEGIINKFHQTKQGSENYEKELEMLQYDILYGDLEAYGGVNPFVKKKNSRGVDQILINNVMLEGEALFVYGENFTKWSEVFMDGVQQETIFVDENTLIITHSELTLDTSFKVSQMTVTGRKLSSTKAFTLRAVQEALIPLEDIENEYLEDIMTHDFLIK